MKNSDRFDRFHRFDLRPPLVKSEKICRDIGYSIGSKD
ncbi:hypothetical protein LEP1GSC052_1774 [Leptospira kmetyi serovar Malaysia str. Bejo-Iso9]|nr:hypothetical protein LEP1GSC052_1774 [Leptospira kmetyi serovar Malaysia str. Bejo-Iso9]